jgi:hypothetical protein
MALPDVCLLNVVAEWLELLFHIEEVPESGLGQETSYPGENCLWFSSVCPDKCQKHI